MKNDCSIVKDLIPLYAEGIVSVETKEFIDDHFQSCENCRKLLEALAKSPDEQETNDNKKEKIWSEIATKEQKRNRGSGRCWGRSGGPHPSLLSAGCYAKNFGQTPKDRIDQTRCSGQTGSAAE